MSIFHRQLNCGLQLIAEPLPEVQSVALHCAVPAGLARQSPQESGISHILCDMLSRGTTSHTAREWAAALDALGVARGFSLGRQHLNMSARLLGIHLEKTLPLFLGALLSPRFDPDSLEPARDLCLQELDAIKDVPQQQVTTELITRHAPNPFNRHPLGEREVIASSTMDNVKDFWQRHVIPQGAVISCAGAVDPEAFFDQIESLTANWTGEADTLQCNPPTGAGKVYLPADSTQVHIAMAGNAVKATDPLRSAQQISMSVLSGGMGARLFTEVREKRGLCYAVHAQYGANSHYGSFTAYAGTTTARASETLDVMCHEFQRMSEGITSEEYQRAVVGLRTGLVMQGESPASRATSLSSDWLTLGYTRTLDDAQQELRQTSLDDVNTFLANHPLVPLTTIWLGQHDTPNV